MAAGTAWVLNLAPHLAPYVLAVIALAGVGAWARRLLAKAEAERHQPPHNGPHPMRRKHPPQ